MAEGRSIVEQLLFTYGALADAKDVEAALEHLRFAEVTFPTGSMSGGAALREHYTTLWSKPEPHRHVITNVRISQTEQGYSGQALYTRWEFTPEPLMTTLGEYEVQVSQHDEVWAIDALAVSRTWHLS